ncbi:MAG TPA: transglycosylase family protein, partial [Candidatus Saccharimonadales bacterium]|nr:transglycosylase family protein [Candidatus Saccharimonadales bacterium]
MTKTGKTKTVKKASTKKKSGSPGLLKRFIPYKRFSKVQLVLVVGLLVLGGFLIYAVLAEPPKSRDYWNRIAPHIRQCESGNNYGKNTGNGYYGAYQFSLSTWRSVGGSGYPHQAAPATQDELAYRLYAKASIASQWPVCGPRAERIVAGGGSGGGGGSAPPPQSGGGDCHFQSVRQGSRGGC